jgi:hypothetical protein
MRRLTQAEVEALPVGTRVYVKWSGGNGPFWYVIDKDKWGNKTINSTHRSQYEVRLIHMVFVKNAHIGLKAPSTTVDVEE